jgi:glutathione S-transferase
MDLPYVFHPVHPRSGETYSPEFLKINPRHKVPVLRHGSLIVAESAAIIQYLSEAFDPPNTFYVPRRASERARVNEWCYFVMAELDAHTLYVIRRHVSLKHLYGEAPVAVEAARTYFFDQLNAMAPRVGAEGEFLFGDKVSVADILLTTCLDWAVEYEFPLPDGLHAYHERALTRPAYKSAWAKTFQGGAQPRPILNSV